LLSLITLPDITCATQTDPEADGKTDGQSGKKWRIKETSTTRSSGSGERASEGGEGGGGSEEEKTLYEEEVDLFVAVLVLGGSSWRSDVAGAGAADKPSVTPTSSS